MGALTVGGLSGCGDTTVTVTRVVTPTPRGGNPPVVVVTATPNGNIGEGPTPVTNPNFSGQMTPNDCETLQPNATTDYTVSGDVKVGGRRVYDDNGKTGTLVTITGSQAVEVCAPYGANVTPIDPAGLAPLQSDIIKQMMASGCENNAGCSDGIQTFTYTNGTLTNTGIRR